MSENRVISHCLKSGQPFGFSAILERIRRVPFFCAGVALSAFFFVWPGDGLTAGAWIAGGLTFLLASWFVIRGWKNRLYRTLRHLGLASLVLVMSGLVYGSEGAPLRGKVLLYAGVLLLVLQIPLYPKLQPIEMEENNTDIP